MRVWIVNHYAYAPFHSAGTRHHSLAKALLERGHDVLVVSTSFYHKSRRETRLGPGEGHRMEIVDGVPFLWLRSPPYSGNGLDRAMNMVGFAWAVFRERGLQREPAPDVVVGSSPDLLAAAAAERVARRRRVPFVLEVRDLWPQTLVDVGGMHRRHPLVVALGLIERRLYRRASRILTLLPGSEPFIAGRGADRRRITWLPNGVHSARFALPDPPRGRAPFTLMYTGAMGRYNGLDLVLDAAERLERGPQGGRLRIVLLGDGPYRARLESLAASRGIRSVRFEPPVPKRDIPSKLLEADAFLMIMENADVFRWGISPNKLYEYMAAGRPVVFCVPTPYNPVQEAGAGLTARPGDASSLADAIERIVATPYEERVAMGRNGRDHVRKRHDFTVLAEQLEATLVETCRDAASGRGTSAG